MRVIRHRLRSEAGFTLVELLAGMAISMVILLAAFELLDSSVRLTHRTEQRVGATQRGRQAMDTMTRALRSQVCLAKAQPIVEAKWSGSVQSLTFYSDFSDASGATPPQRRVLAYDRAAGTITESVFIGTISGTTVSYTTPPRVTQLLQDVAPNPDVAVDGSGNRPVFRFYKFDTAPKPTWSGPLALPLSAADRVAVTKISIAFGVRREKGPTSEAPLSVQEDDVFVRAADPNLTNPTPTCA